MLAVDDAGFLLCGDGAHQCVVTSLAAVLP